MRILAYGGVGIEILGHDGINRMQTEDVVLEELLIEGHYTEGKVVFIHDLAGANHAGDIVRCRIVSSCDNVTGLSIKGVADLDVYSGIIASTKGMNASSVLITQGVYTTDWSHRIRFFGTHISWYGGQTEGVCKDTRKN